MRYSGKVVCNRQIRHHTYVIQKGGNNRLFHGFYVVL